MNRPSVIRLDKYQKKRQGYLKQLDRIEQMRSEGAEVGQVLGASVRLLRKLGGVSQKSLATELGVLQSAISRIENGLQGVTVAQLVVLSRMFRVSIDDLVHGTIADAAQGLIDSSGGNRAGWASETGHDGAGEAAA